MTDKELREIKRRFRPEKTNISEIVGCIVNTNKEIIAKISQSVGVLESVASEKLLAVMKKALSGSIGTSLSEIPFSTKAVTDGEEHKLLMELRRTSLKDDAVLMSFYSKVAESLSFDGNYAILLANDKYDVPSFSKNGDGAAESGEVFSYIVCAICPLKNSPESLSFKESDKLFHAISASSVISTAELGFMFPAFDDRKTNIYSALYYTRSLSESYGEFTENIFGAASPMPPKLQRAAFSESLSDCLGEECSLDLVRQVHEQIAELVEQHKESRDPEPLKISKATVRCMLSDCGVSEEKIADVAKAMDETFGAGAELSPKNLVSVNKFELKTPDVSIKISPEHRDLVSTRTVGGEKYIMIRAVGEVEINGISVKIDD